ncbi:MAG: U32 family peptidase [Spirochaetales bacterium]|nr:U32 family peptidase [Spirochaetales bacterium]
MELVSPAGNLEKLKTAYLYGADACYAGLPGFSLRERADNLDPERLEEVAAAKAGKKLYGAFNICFTDADLDALERTLERLPEGLFDAFILSDPGAAGMFRGYFPRTPLHLSTQANCANASAALVWRDLGFSRIIPARELGLKDIEAMKKRSGLEIEVFVHGAMCLSYSGRCHLSAYLTGRSANRGDCAHPCRWEYRALEEAERPGEYFPAFEGEGFSSILSSKDLCLFDHLRELRDAGVDAVKIEGRMKSVYYTAVTARAYRRAVDRIEGRTDEDPTPYKEELYKVSRREFSTGFLFGKDEIAQPTFASYARDYLFMGTVMEKTAGGLFRLDLKNRLKGGEPVEYVGWDILFIPDSGFALFDGDKEPAPHIDHGKTAYLKTDKPLKPGYLIRKKL